MIPSLSGEVFSFEEFDIDFEFDAPRFYDFSRPELDSETEEIEFWFESAGNYPPSRKTHAKIVFLLQSFVLFLSLSLSLTMFFFFFFLSGYFIQLLAQSAIGNSSRLSKSQTSSPKLSLLRFQNRL